MDDGPRIGAAGSAFPPHYYTQEQLSGELKKYWGSKLQIPEVLDRLYANEGVEGRYLALPTEAYYDLTSWGKANDAWIACAQEVGQAAICRALATAGLSHRDVNALFVVSVTGIASPSLDARLINRMDLNPNVKRVPIFGLGCVAGAAGIARAADYVRAFPDHVACLLAVELCSLTLQRDDLSMANLISSGLFGDGAAAVLVTGSQRPVKGPRILSTRSIFYPGTEDVMGWRISENGFHIVLSANVPQVIQQHLREDVDSFLGDHGLTRGDIGTWILHPGGPKVLKATAAALELPPEAIAVSWEVLRKVGNLSSASVLLVLEQVFRDHNPKPGTYGLLAAMGPGFCSELVLLQW